MGFMRKTLFLGTGGMSGLVVKANSKKERTAKAAEKQVRLQRQALRTNQRATTAPGRPVPTRIGPQEGWVNELSVRLAGEGWIEQRRNTGTHLAGIPMETDIVFGSTEKTRQGPRYEVIARLFSTAELADKLHSA